MEGVKHLFKVGLSRDGIFHELPYFLPRNDGHSRRLDGRLQGATFSHSATHVQRDGLHVSLSYTATSHVRHTLPLLSPLLAAMIASISCNTSHVTIRPMAGASAQLNVALSQRFVPGTLITGSCESSAVAAVPFYRTAHALRLTNGSVALATENASLSDAFGELKMDFSFGSNADTPPEASEQQGSEQASTTRSGRRLFLSKIGDSLNDLGEAVMDGSGKLLAGGGRIVNGVIDAVVDGLNGGVISDVVGRFKDALPDSVTQHWDAVVSSVKGFFTGMQFSDDITLNLVASCGNRTGGIFLHHWGQALSTPHWSTSVAAPSFPPQASLNYDNASRSAIEKSVRFNHTPWLACEDCYLNAELNASVRIEFGPVGTPELFHAEVRRGRRSRPLLTSGCQPPHGPRSHPHR